MVPKPPPEMQPPRTTPRAIPAQPPGPRRGRWLLSSVGLALATLGFLTLPRWFERRERSKYQAALHAREVDLTRWQGWLETGHCLRRDDGARWLAALDKLAAEPTSANLEDTAGHGALVDAGCLTALAPLETDPALPAAAHAVVHDWIAADRALADPTRQPPDQLRRLIGDRDRLLSRVRRTLVPPVNAAIRQISDLHAAKHDYVWWRIELGFLLEDVLDAGAAAHRDGRDVTAAIATPLRRLTDKAPGANTTAGVRELPAVNALARASGDAAWTALQAVEDNGAWNELAHDNIVFGPMPAEPQGCDVPRE
jgi:hypothetical protein